MVGFLRSFPSPLSQDPKIYEELWTLKLEYYLSGEKQEKSIHALAGLRTLYVK